MNQHYASSVVGFVREHETPEAIIRGTTPEVLAQVERWILGAVTIHARMHRSVSFRQLAAGKMVDRPLLGPLLARLVDRGALLWADDGGYLPVRGAS